ncbi:MAG: hypothetical protein ACPHJZ_05285, partial [Limisphaerales bacterium]
MLVLDYCFIRNSADEDLLTILVGKLYPFRKVFAVPVNMKGNDNAAINRLVDFIRESGVVQYTYRCDQESSLNSMVDRATREASIKALVEEAARRGGRAATFAPLAVPENSAVGSSASNGRAERTVQIVEDLIRTMKSALDSRLEAR